MSADSTSRHTRIDSGVSIAQPTHNALVSVQDICNAVSLFRAHDGFQSLENLASVIPQLRSDIQTKEEIIRNLANETAAAKQSSEHARLSQLSDFQQRYDQWKKDETLLQSSSQEWEASCQRQRAEIIQLQEELKKCKSKMRDYETEISVKTKRSKGFEQQLGDSEARLEKVMDENHGLIQKQNQIAKDRQSLEEDLAQEKKDHKVSKSELAGTKEELQTYQQFSVKMENLSLQKVIPKLEGLWKGLVELVGRSIGHDLPPATLESDWKVLGTFGIFKLPMTLPKSNSPVAKRVRVALIVGLVSVLICKLIFRPTYLLGEGGGEMREVLYDQAIADEGKERHLRGILLSMFPDYQEKIIGDHPSNVVKGVLVEENIQTLLEPDRLEEFSEQLRRLIVEFSKTWRAIQRARQKIEPDFSNPPSNDQKWYILDESYTSPGKEGRCAKTLDTGSMETKVVVIPPVYLVKQGEDPKPITHGYVFDKAHIDAATEEVRRATPSAPFSHDSLYRRRSRSERTAVNGTSQKSQRGHFLS